MSLQCQFRFAYLCTFKIVMEFCNVQSVLVSLYFAIILLKTDILNSDTFQTCSVLLNLSYLCQVNLETKLLIWNYFPYILLAKEI